MLGLQQQLMPCKAPLALVWSVVRKAWGIHVLLIRDELVRHPSVFILSTVLLSRDEEGGVMFAQGQR